MFDYDFILTKNDYISILLKAMKRDSEYFENHREVLISGKLY